MSDIVPMWRQQNNDCDTTKRRRASCKHTIMSSFDRSNHDTDGFLTCCRNKLPSGSLMQIDHRILPSRDHRHRLHQQALCMRCWSRFWTIKCALRNSSCAWTLSARQTLISRSIFPAAGTLFRCTEKRKPASTSKSRLSQPVIEVDDDDLDKEYEDKENKRDEVDEDEPTCTQPSRYEDDDAEA